jgi:hypothetical protein
MDGRLVAERLLSYIEEYKKKHNDYPYLTFKHEMYGQLRVESIEPKNEILILKVFHPRKEL